MAKIKYDWENAPEWANFAAVDGDGQMFWYEEEPEYIQDGNFWSVKNGNRILYQSEFDASETIEKRPE